MENLGITSVQLQVRYPKSFCLHLPRSLHSLRTLRSPETRFVKPPPLPQTNVIQPTGYIPDVDEKGEEKWPRGDETTWKAGLKGVDSSAYLYFFSVVPILFVGWSGSPCSAKPLVPFSRNHPTGVSINRLIASDVAVDSITKSIV